MPALSRLSLRSLPTREQEELSSKRRAALRTTLRRFERQTSTPGLGHPAPFPGLQFHIWMPLFLIPLILGFMVLISITRVFSSALRWIVIWCTGFFVAGFVAWGMNALFGTGYSARVAWASGGFLGLVVLSSFYGMCLEWVFWLARHENNRYVGVVSLSPEQQANRVQFAKSLHWPTALGSACGGFVFAIALFPVIAGTETEWPSLGMWAALGGLGLAVQGLLLGLFLGVKRNRVVFDSSKHSLGEFVGWQIAGERKGWRPALGWALGYALHQLPTGIMAGFVLGALANLLFW